MKRIFALATLALLSTGTAAYAAAPEAVTKLASAAMAACGMPCCD